MIGGVPNKRFVRGGDWLGLPSGATGCIKAMGPEVGCNSVAGTRQCGGSCRRGGRRGSIVIGGHMQQVSKGSGVSATRLSSSGIAGLSRYTVGAAGCTEGERLVVRLSWVG